ncbi:MAG: Zn peptidase [Verrucomicrobiales bacterium]|nr:Zn peptidase [Verrucomicrobiales bacterium]
MTTQRIQLAREALNKALSVRTAAGYQLVDPICIYDLAEKRQVEVRFADIPSLEGMYSGGATPAIILGSERPAGRRTYTCGHELGHHEFGHGTHVDELNVDEQQPSFSDPKEFIAQCFAGFILMPKLAVCNAFAIRGWKPEDATAEQIFRIANLFGVTYGGLINHMNLTLRLLPPTRAYGLLQVKLKQIRAAFIADAAKQLIVVDLFWKGRPVDLEASDYVIFPLGTVCEGTALVHVGQNKNGELFEAVGPGHARVSDPVSGWASFVRVSRKFYAGRSMYRHFEEVKDE